MNAPKKIWIIRDRYVADPEQTCEKTTPYIREDLVEELVEALEDATDAMTVFAELNSNTAKAKAALAKLEENHEV